MQMPPLLLLLGVDDVLHQLDLLLLPALGRRKQHLQEQESGINSLKLNLEPILRRNFCAQVVFCFGQPNGNYFGFWLDQNISFAFRYLIIEQPIWLQALEVLLLSDFLIYWGHRFQHKYDFLWRFHKVHHTTETLDWLAAHREHPLDSIYTVGIINLPALILGFNLYISLIIRYLP